MTTYEIQLLWKTDIPIVHLPSKHFQIKTGVLLFPVGMTFSKFPLLFILSARELKKSPNQDEIDYCKQQLRYIENRHNNSPWYNPRYTSETEQELLTNLALFFIECTPIERQLSDEALELCEKIKGKRDDIPSLNHYKDKTAFLHDILDSKK